MVLGSEEETTALLHSCSHNGREQVGHAVVEIDKMHAAVGDEYVRLASQWEGGAPGRVDEWGGRITMVAALSSPTIV